jgi:hypothetical protein
MCLTIPTIVGICQLKITEPTSKDYWRTVYDQYLSDLRKQAARDKQIKWFQQVVREGFRFLYQKA